MKCKIIPLLLLGFAIQLRAQHTPDKFRLGITAAVDNNISGKSVAFDEYTGYATEYDKTNYRIGLNAEYELKERIAINSAIQYSNKDFTGMYYCEVCDFIIPPEPEDIELRFIEIPVTLRYYFLPGQWKPYGEIGLNNQFAIKKEIIDNSYALGLKLGGGIEYEINPGLAIRLLADYNKGLTNLMDESGFKMDYWGVGIGFLTRL